MNTFIYNTYFDKIQETFCKMQVEDAIINNIKGDTVKFYCHKIINNEYRSVWKSDNGNVCIFATIENYDDSTAKIILEPVGYNIT